MKAIRTGSGWPPDVMKAPVKTAPFGMPGLDQLKDVAVIKRADSS